MANSDGYALEHRLVLHDVGVEIPPRTHVHHRNGDKADNRLENLEVKTPRAHALGHIEERGGWVTNQHGRHRLRQRRKCQTCGKMFNPWTWAGRFCSRACANGRSK